MAKYDEVFVNSGATPSGNIFKDISTAVLNCNPDGTVTVTGGSYSNGGSFNGLNTIWQAGTSEGYGANGKGISVGVNNGTYTGNTSITVTGGYIREIYGAGYNGTVDGDTYIRITGGAMEYVSGAGYKATVTGTAKIHFSGNDASNQVVLAGAGEQGTVKNVDILVDGGNCTIFGCGYNKGGTAETVTITITAGTCNTVVAGGYGGDGYAGTATTTVSGGTVDNLSATEGGRVDNNVFLISGGSLRFISGGGLGYTAGSVGTTSITISGTTEVTGFLQGGGQSSTGSVTMLIKAGSFAKGVYGGGFGNSVTGQTNVTIQGGVFEANVFGGGRSASVSGAAELTITAGTIKGNIYGGSENGSVGSATTSVSGVTLTGNVYGGGLFNGTAARNETTANHSYKTIMSIGIGGNAFGGHQISTTGGYTGTADSELKVFAGNSKLYAGGSSVTAGFDVNDEITGNSKLIFAVEPTPYDIDPVVPRDTPIVSASKYAIGGSLVGGPAKLTVNGNSDVTVQTGVFSGLVAGGGMVQSANATLTQNGNTSVTIASGGTFNGNIYGGHISTKLAYSAHTVLNGSTSVSVYSYDDVNIGANIFGGSNGSGTVSDGSSITFSGYGANLTFTGKISGDSSSAGTYNGVHQEYVSVDRSLNFTGFTGDFNTSGIYNIDTLKVSDASAVNMTDAAIDLSNVNNWDFEAGSSFAFGGINDFTGDTLDITGTADGLGWTVFDGGSADSIANWDQLGAVTLFGQTASFDSDLAMWTSTDYKLFADTTTNDLKVGMIA